VSEYRRSCLKNISPHWALLDDAVVAIDESDEEEGDDETE
jgi:hypothetical protein